MKILIFGRIFCVSISIFMARDGKIYCCSLQLYCSIPDTPSPDTSQFNVTISQTFTTTQHVPCNRLICGTPFETDGDERRRGLRFQRLTTWFLRILPLGQLDGLEHCAAFRAGDILMGITCRFSFTAFWRFQAACAQVYILLLHSPQ